MSNISNKMSNAYNETMGSAKEKLGHATHNEHMAGAGAAQKADAQINQQNLKAQTHAQGVGHNIQGEAQMAAGTATNDPNLRARGQANDPNLGVRGQANDPNLRARGQAYDDLGDVQRTY